MPSDIEYLYQSILMEHMKNPRNQGLVHDPSYQSLHVNNPSCGDEITLEVLVEDGMIKDIKQEGHGCTISMASASIITETLVERSVEEGLAIIKDFYEVVKGQDPDDDKLGDAVAMKGVSKFPMRIKCATLSWKACERILKGLQNVEV